MISGPVTQQIRHLINHATQRCAKVPLRVRVRTDMFEAYLQERATNPRYKLSRRYPDLLVIAGTDPGVEVSLDFV